MPGHVRVLIVTRTSIDTREDRVGCEIGEKRYDICFTRPRGKKRRREEEIEKIDENEIEIEEEQQRETADGLHSRLDDRLYDEFEA